MKRLVVCCVLCALAGIWAGRLWMQVQPPPTAQSQEPPPRVFSSAEQTNIHVYETAHRGVVHITTRSYQPGEMFFFDPVPTSGDGSGCVLDQQGRILTNYHVIENAEQAEVTLFDGTSFPAQLVGADPSNDIAVLQIDAPADKLIPIQLGTSTNLKVGQQVFAIGNPFGLDQTLTVGIISSLNRILASRTARTMKEIIQIDAALNPGNSGGALLDNQASLIGMNTAIASRTQENTGVGFAIPVSTIKRVVPQLIEHGRVIRPDLGITDVLTQPNGLLIVGVAPDGPAARAGIEGFRLVRVPVTRGPYSIERRYVDRSRADLITDVDDRPVRSIDDLLSIIETRKPGDTVTLRVEKQGETRQVVVTLGESE